MCRQVFAAILCLLFLGSVVGLALCTVYVYQAEKYFHSANCSVTNCGIMPDTCYEPKGGESYNCSYAIYDLTWIFDNQTYTVHTNECCLIDCSSNSTTCYFDERDPPNSVSLTDENPRDNGILGMSFLSFLVLVFGSLSVLSIAYAMPSDR